MPFCPTIVSYNFFEITGFEREPTIGNVECKSGGEGWGPSGLVCQLYKDMIVQYLKKKNIYVQTTKLNKRRPGWGPGGLVCQLYKDLSARAQTNS